MTSTVTDSNTRGSSTDVLEEARDLKTASAPIVKAVEETKLKPQISAPSYLKSLADNPLPPFRKPEKEIRPVLLVGGTDPLVSAEDIVYIIAASDADPENGMKNYLGRFIITKNIVHSYELAEKTFLVRFLMETVDYAAQRDFTAAQLACLFTIYLTTHKHFKCYYWTPPAATWNFFKELMIRHSIQDSPDGQEVFDTDDCYDILTHFHTMYMNNLPLIHIATFGTYRLRIGWPFKK